MNRKIQIGDPPIRIARQDLEKLETILDSLHRSYARISLFLQNEVLRAQVVDVASDRPFVRLGSRVRFTDEQEVEREGTLFAPEEGRANPPDGISVLTPAGCALLGLSVGQSIRYETIDRRIKHIRVTGVEEPAG